MGKNEVRFAAQKPKTFRDIRDSVERKLVRQSNIACGLNALARAAAFRLMIRCTGHRHNMAGQRF